MKASAKALPKLFPVASSTTSNDSNMAILVRQPMIVHKPDGRTLTLASLYDMAVHADSALVMDVRDPDEVEDSSAPVQHAVLRLPMNMDQQKQSIRPTRYEDFVEKYERLNLSLPYDTTIIAHCGSGGRGALAVEYLVRMGFQNVLNGGDPHRVRAALYEHTEAILAAGGQT